MALGFYFCYKFKQNIFLPAKLVDNEPTNAPLGAFVKNNSTLALISQIFSCTSILHFIPNIAVLASDSTLTFFVLNNNNKLFQQFIKIYLKNQN